jgi:formylglycine-generating enzyme required for sulfatase activity
MKQGRFSVFQIATFAIPLLILSFTGAADEESLPISSLEELQRIGMDANYPLDGNYALIQDINAAVTVTWNDGAGFRPIGDYTTPFTGRFNGQGYKITGLVINRPTQDDVGLFGVLGQGGCVENLRSEEISISGYLSAGGLVGHNRGGTVSSCSTKGTVTGNYACAGGLVGYNQGGSITSCYTTASVTGFHAYVGGLIGYNHGGLLTTCYATGAVAALDDYCGGLAGSNYGGTITYCYATGAVTGTNDYAGGLLGFNDGTVVSCYWDTGTSGMSSSFGGRGLNTSQMKTISYYRNAGWGNSSWVMIDAAYPRLAWEGLDWQIIPEPEAVPFIGNGTENDPYLITSANEFAVLSWRPEITNAHIRLLSDLSLLGVNLYPIGDFGAFSGEFDGGGFALRHIILDHPGTRCVGLFGIVNSEGFIHDLTVENVMVTGREYVGGLVGLNYGTVMSCNITGIINATGDYAHVGGLIGYNYEGTVTTCWTTGSVTATADYAHAGGLMGLNDGIMSSCYARGPVSAMGNATYSGGLTGYNFYSAITSSYATGSVSGSSYVGGLMGKNSGSVSSTYWDINTSGQNTSPAGEGRPTLPMTYPYDPDTYVNWDFENVWTPDEQHLINDGYPYLRDNAPPEAEEGEDLPYLAVSPPDRDVGAFPGSTTFTVAASAIWTANSDQAWATVSPSFGMRRTTLTVYYEGNRGAARTAQITITGTNTNPGFVSCLLNQSVDMPEGEGEPVEEKTILLPGDVPLVLVSIPSGTYSMGRYTNEQDSSVSEEPQHQVSIGYDFYMGKHEVTQAQWRAIMNTDPSYFSGDTLPVEQVSWNDARDFMSRLNAHIAATGQGPETVRLPSEAEWEYACRAGTESRFYWGNDPEYLLSRSFAWHRDNSVNTTHAVGEKYPNSFGLYDTSGNLLELCEDDWHDGYVSAPDDGAAWVNTPRSAYRVLRGGSWNSQVSNCRSAFRNYLDPNSSENVIGFRVAAVVIETEGEGEGEIIEGEGEIIEGEGEIIEGEGEIIEGEGEIIEGEGEIIEGEGEIIEGEGEIIEGEGEIIEGEGEIIEGEGEIIEGEGEIIEGEGEPIEGEDEPIEGEGEPIEGEGEPVEGEGEIIEGEGEIIEGEGEIIEGEGETDEGEGKTDEGCGCCLRTENLKGKWKHYLGDWLLVGLSLLVMMSAFNTKKRT